MVGHCRWRCPKLPQVKQGPILAGTVWALASPLRCGLQASHGTLGWVVAGDHCDGPCHGSSPSGLLS